MGQNVVVVGTQWGDEGKGKIVDLLTEKTSAVIPIDALSQYMDREGMGINPDVIKDLITNDPIVKNLVKSFDGDKITIDTIVEPKDPVPPVIK